MGVFSQWSLLAVGPGFPGVFRDSWSVLEEMSLVRPPRFARSGVRKHRGWLAFCLVVEVGRDQTGCCVFCPVIGPKPVHLLFTTLQKFYLVVSSTTSSFYSCAEGKNQEKNWSILFCLDQKS